MKMRTFVIGDIHGRYNELRDVLYKSKFDYKKDKLIVLGDIVDGGPDTFEAVEKLLEIKKLVYIIGNHDQWLIDYLNSKGNEAPITWLSQGGRATLDSYKENTGGIPLTHYLFFKKGKYYHKEKGMLFVHGGYMPKLALSKTPKEFLLWDRTIIDKFNSGCKGNGYKKIFIGHTPTNTIISGDFKPIKIGKLICMDTGAGWNGRLTIMDIDTEEYWQSGYTVPPIRISEMQEHRFE